MSDSGSTTISPRPRSALASVAVLGLAAAAVSFSLFYVAQRYWLDDSFISFRYARNLVEGHGLVYNPGDHVEGYTNFLWTMVAALAELLRIEPIYFTQGVSLLAQAATLWVLFEIGRASGRSDHGALLAPLFLATSVAFLTYPMTGMETSFFTLLLTLGFLLVRRRAARTRGGGIALGLVLLALALTRFDGFGPVILLVSAALVFDRRGLRARDWVLPLSIFAAGLALYNLWRLWYYPTPLPNTFYAKTTFTPKRMLAGLLHLKAFATGPGAAALMLGLVPFVLLRASRAAWQAAWIFFGQAAYVAVVGGDWMPHYRFLLPVLPALLVMMQEGWAILAEALRGRARWPGFSAVAATAVLLAFHLVPLYDGRKLEELSGKHYHPHDARRIGLYLDQHLAGDMLIAMEWGGIIPYYTHHRTLDTYGLTDRDIVSRQNFPATIWGRRIPPGYLKARGVDLVAPCAHLMPTERAARESIRPDGPNHYSYYPTLNNNPKLGYQWTMIQIDEGAWWPALVRRRNPEQVDDP